MEVGNGIWVCSKCDSLNNKNDSLCTCCGNIKTL